MTSRGRKPYCKACAREYTRRWAANNPDMERAKSARRRARGGGANFKFSIRQKLFQNQNGRCFYTGAEMDILDAHIDHKVPISRGGTDDFSNLVLCTAEANLLKHNKTAEEFIAWCKERRLFQSLE